MLAAQKLFRCACHRYNFSQSKNRADKDVTIMNITNKVLNSTFHIFPIPTTTSQKFKNLFCQQTRKNHEKISLSDISSWDKKQDWKCIFLVFVRLKSYLFSAEFKSQHQFSALSQVVTLLPKTKSKKYPKFDTCRTVSLKHIAVKKCCVPSLKNLLNFSSEESSQKQSKCHLKCISTNKGSLGGKLITWWHDPVITD